MVSGRGDIIRVSTGDREPAVDDAILRFLTHLKTERGASENTVQAYQADLRQMARVFAGRLGRAPALADLTTASLDGYLEWLIQQSYRPATVARKTAAIRSFLDFLAREGATAVPAAASVLKVPPSQRPARRVLSPGEIASLLDAPAGASTPRGLRDAAVLGVLYTTGMRASEIVNLRLEDVDLARGLAFRRGANSADDQSLLLGSAVEPLRRYLREGRPLLVRSPDEPALFLNQRGQRLSRQGLWLVIRRWASASGLSDDVSPHTLRRSLAQHLLDAGQSRRQVQTLLGLSSPNALNRPDVEAPAPLQD